MESKDKKLINSIIEEKPMEDCKKIQWSIFSPDRQQQYVIRVDTYAELEDLREFVLKDIPKEKAFPDDTGPVATPPSQVVKAAPKCGVHGLVMNLKPAGVSKTGRAYPAFWSCGQKNSDGSYCQFRPQESV